MCLSVPVWMGLISPYYVFFVKDYIFTIRRFPQIWRCLTTFILTGPKIGLILDPYFLYTYGSRLETTSPAFSQPGDFFVYLVFVALVILVSLLYAIVFRLLYTSFSSKPRISARTVRFSNCHGSWKRGRLPLHCAAIVIRNHT